MTEKKNRPDGTQFKRYRPRCGKCGKRIRGANHEEGFHCGGAVPKNGSARRY